MAGTDSERDLSKNFLSKWAEQYIPEKSLGARAMFIFVVFLSIPALVEWIYPEQKYFKDFGAYVGAIIGLGGLVLVTIYNHQRDLVTREKTADASLYIRTQALIAHVTYLEESCRLLMDLLTAVTEPDNQRTRDAIKLTFPRQREWEMLVEQLPAMPSDIQLHLNFAFGMGARTLRVVKINEAVEAEGTPPEGIYKMAITSSRSAMAHMEAGRESLLDLANYLAMKLDRNVDVIERSGNDWLVSGREPDCERASRYHDPRNPS